MLHSQDFTAPPLILLGHELFFDAESPHQISIERTADFVTRIASPGNFSFMFVSRRNPAGMEDDPCEFYNHLRDLKVPFTSMYVVNPLNPMHWNQMNQLLRIADFGYAPELFSSPLILLKSKCAYIDPAGLIDCLLEAVYLPIPFSYEVFSAIQFRRLQQK